MRRIIIMLLVLALFIPVLSAFAEAALPAEALQTAVEEFLKLEMARQVGLAKDEWEKYIFSQGIGAVTLELEDFNPAGKKPLSVSFLVANGQPDYKSQPPYEGDPTPWLEAVIKSMGEPKATVKLKLTIAETGGKYEVTFAKGAEASLQKAIKGLAGKAPKAVADKRMTAALVDYVMPTPIILPKKAPEDISLETRNPAYTAYLVRNRLDPFAEGAFARALLYAPRGHKLNASRGPEKVVLSYTIPSVGAYMVDSLAELVTKILPYDEKAKQYTQEELLTQFSDHLEKGLLSALYEKKSGRTETYMFSLLDLPKTVLPDDLFQREEQPPTSVAFDCVAAMEELIKELPEYPALPLPANGVVVGDNKGTKVIFTFFKTPYDHHAVSAYDHWTNELVCVSFSADRKKVEMRLPKGDYDFKISAGSVWYGPENMFGPFGSSSFLSGNYLELRAVPYKITVNMSE